MRDLGGMDRRQFLAMSGSALLWPAVCAKAQLPEPAADAPAQQAGPAPQALPPTKPFDRKVERVLGTSQFVYVSPLKSNGRESHCHGEVWFAHLRGGVVLLTSNQSWKVRALTGGLDRARVWVGSYGRWKRLKGFNTSFRQAPSFEARAEFVRDEALLEELLAVYERKYPDEIGRWRKPMRDGYRNGTRLLIRYSPA